MGKRGPAGKPNKLKLLQGTYRKDRDKTAVTPELSIPRCPSFLKGEARREWKRVTAELAAIGIISQLDRAALSAYCTNWEMYVEADKVIRTEGLTYTNSQGRVLSRPEVAISNRAMRQMRAFLTEFGMTPASRGKITVPEKQKSDNPFTSLLGSGPG